MSKTPLHLLPALSIKQPWAWAILNAGKRIENRSRITRYRGEFLIHASLNHNMKEYASAREFMERINVSAPPFNGADVKRGGIVGVARVVDCFARAGWDDEADPREFDPWFVGHFGYVLADVRPLPFIPCKGMLGFFNHGLPAEAFAQKGVAS